MAHADPVWPDTGTYAAHTTFMDSDSLIYYIM